MSSFEKVKTPEQIIIIIKNIKKKLNKTNSEFINNV